MSEQSTASRPFFKPLPEHDTLNIAYFLAKISEQVVVAPSGCWEWIGRTNGDGYGVIEAGGRRHMVHRMVYSLCVAPIPGRLLVLHRCDNPPCCKPVDLFAGDEAANNRDCVAKGRHPELKVTDEQALTIRTRASTGKRGILKVLAAEYHLSLSGLRRIVYGEGRHHLDPKAGFVEYTDEQRARAAAFLREFRAAHGLSQAEVGELLGFTKGYISRVESGKRAACNALVVVLAELAGGAA